jgi:hypothetical protein
MSSPAITCPHCATNLTVRKPEKLGKPIRCPRCGKMFASAAAAPAAAPIPRRSHAPLMLAVVAALVVVAGLFLIGMTGALIFVLKGRPHTTETAPEIAEKAVPDRLAPDGARGSGKAQPDSGPGIGTTKHALLIGVNNYEGTGLGSLNHTVRDMESMQAKLKETNFKVQLLRNQEATKARIESELAKLKSNRAVGELVLVAMSGHGVQTRNSKGQEDAFYCPFGCDKSEIDSMFSLTQLVEGLGSKGVNLVLVDACRNDPRKGFRGIQGNELQDRLPANTAVFFSCSAGQQSFETNRMYGE